MRTGELFTDHFTRIHELVHDVLDGAGEHVLGHRVDPEAGTVGWLVWHLTRIQDDHVAGAAGTGQAWLDEGWAGRFDLPLPAADTGYGHDPDQVAAVRPTADLLTGYHDAVHRRTLAALDGWSADDLDRVVDEDWDPPVTLGVRLVSVVGDALQHLGQAAFVRGVAERAGG